jgi:hypothetical protein
MAICDKHGPYSTFCRECDMDTILLHRVIEALHKEDHYKFIEKYGKLFSQYINIPNVTDISDYLSCDGDKAYQYKERWFSYGIPFPIGVMVYLLSKVRPYSSDCRSTEHGWVPVEQWVVSAIKGIPKDLEGESYQNLRKACKAVLDQYTTDITNITKDFGLL